MNILGIHTGHDASLAMIKDGRLVLAVSMERYSGLKKSSLIKMEYLERFLWDCNVQIEDIDCISMGFWDQSNIPFMRIYSPENENYPLSVFGRYNLDVAILNHLDNYPSKRENWKPKYVAGLGYTLPDFWDRTRTPYLNYNFRHKMSYNLNVTIEGVDKIFTGRFVDHHVSHCSAAFFTSDFERAAIFTADATGRDATATSLMMIGNGNQLDIFKNPHYSYGTFYDSATELSGLGPGLEKAGVLMGLAAYGNVSGKTQRNWEEWTKPEKHRTETEDTTYDDWLYYQISGRFPHLDSYIPEWRKQQKDRNIHMYTREYQQCFSKEESTSQEVMNIAADIQFMAERSLSKYTQELFEETKTINDGNLCVGGGTFLNCNANYKVLTETDFERMHMFPSCGDDGLSVGSALFVNHVLNQEPRQKYTAKDLMYLGYNYDYYPESKFYPHQLNLDDVAKELSDGKIVCWYQGGGEMGPRALGHRSFLCDPRRKNMKDILNKRVKYREWFRPFAPVVLNEYKSDWFRMDFESPFMLFTVPCKKPFDIPSGVHIDNTARVQTIKKEDNPRFYTLIDKFREITNVPILLNTSLNVKGRPIVETPDDALKLFEESDVDLLVINDMMYYKNKFK